MSDSNRRSNVFAAALHEVAQADKDYWSYKRMGKRPGLHGLIRYPAMMVPQMQADVLDAALAVRPDIRRVVDPFVGSGTTMLEVLRRGLSFEGFDINPLAILICRAKLLSINPRTLTHRVHKLLAQISADQGTSVDVSFAGRDKWFTPTACIQLSRVRRHIVGQRGLAFRQFLWVKRFLSSFMKMVIRALATSDGGSVNCTPVNFAGFEYAGQSFTAVEYLPTRAAICVKRTGLASLPGCGAKARQTIASLTL